MAKNRDEPDTLSISDGPEAFRKVIDRRVAFRAGSLHTGPAPTDPKGCGHLPAWWQDGIIGATYVIYAWPG